MKAKYKNYSSMYFLELSVVFQLGKESGTDEVFEILMAKTPQPCF